MMHAFLSRNHAELIERCGVKVAGRPTRKPAANEDAENGVSLFVDQLIKTLIVEQSSEPLGSRRVSGESGGVKPGTSEMGESAGVHGGKLLQRGFTVDQVVHTYGDVCQAITDLAFEVQEPIEIDEFRTLNRCLDNAVAYAVTEFTYQHNLIATEHLAGALNERLGFFVHELRNLLNCAMHAVTALKAGQMGIGGATAAVLDMSLVGLRNLIDQTLTEVRMAAGVPVRSHLFSLSHFIDEVRLSATLGAKVEECGFSVSLVDRLLAVDGDRDLLLSAVGNLLQNALKYTHSHSEVTLKAYASADRILIEVEDHCGGLPRGSEEKMFESFAQVGEDKNGMGLGLSIARRSGEANRGMLSVRDKPKLGCVFILDLPRAAMPGNADLAACAQPLFG